MDDGKQQTGGRIRLLRLRRGLTQKDLADAAGTGESTIRGYELGNRYPKKEHLEAIAKVLKVRPEALQSQAVLTPLELLHLMFRYEGIYKFVPVEDGVKIEFGGDQILRKGFSDWSKKREELESGEITREEYLEWQDTYSPFILRDAAGDEIPDPYTGKAVEGGDREGAPRGVQLMSDEMQEILAKLYPYPKK